MSVYKNGKLIAGGSQALPLLCYMWTDHVLNHPSWLRSNTFSWQPGTVYIRVYQHLVADIVGKTLQSETVCGTTVQFYLADDGHKICPADQESNVMAIYAATGVAWYHILDTVNQRFKLPRQSQEKNYHGQIIERLSSGVKWAEIYSDGWIRQGGTTDNCNFLVTMASTTYSALVSPRCMYAGERTVGIEVSGKTTTSISISAGNYGANNRDWVVEGWSIRASKEILLESQKYLYFYVGNFTQTALENTAGLNAELFNGKADVSTVAHVVVEFQEPTSANNYTWYRKYADGWVEQGGGIANNSTTTTVTLPVAMANTNYTLVGGLLNGTSSATYEHMNFNTLTTTSFKFTTYDSYGVRWQVSGMAA